jgi:hypothetical protein
MNDEDYEVRNIVVETRLGEHPFLFYLCEMAAHASYIASLLAGLFMVIATFMYGLSTVHSYTDSFLLGMLGGTLATWLLYATVYLIEKKTTWFEEAPPT